MSEPPSVNKKEGEPPLKKQKLEPGNSQSEGSVPVTKATPMIGATVPIQVPITAPVAMQPRVISPVVMSTQVTGAVTMPTLVPVANVTSSMNILAQVAPLANSLPGGINFTISNGSINIKPATTTTGVQPNNNIPTSEGQHRVIQAGASLVRTPVGQVSGGNVTIRSPFAQGGPINVRLPSNPGALNIQVAGQPGMQGTQGSVINTSLLNPLTGRTQAVTFQRAPVSVTLPVGVTASPLSVPIQQQLANVPLRHVSTVQQLPGGQVVTNTNFQGLNVSSGVVRGTAVAGPSVPPLAKPQGETTLGMAQSRAGTSMGMALGLTMTKAAQNKMEQSGASTSTLGEKVDKSASSSAAVKMEETDYKEKCSTPVGNEKMDVKDCENDIDKGDFDAMGALTWDNGVGTLPGSDLKFRMNEFGIMELITGDDQDTNDSGATERCTPDMYADQETSETSESPETVQRSDDIIKGDELIRCLQCGTYGTAADFFKATSLERSCSQACHQLYKTACKTNTIQKLVLSKGKIVKDIVGLKYKKKRLMVDDMNPRQVSHSIGRGRPKVRTMEPEDEEDAEVAKTMASAKKTKGFSWNTYLQMERAPRPHNKLFKNPQAFPSNKNSFKVGMKLEGIDPRHPSLYCVLSVAEVRGYRIRLHFDGYSECHDFWLNASSVDIFPVGWCEKNNKRLQVPKGFSSETFSWPSYLKLSKAQAAHKHLFQNQQAASLTPHGFRVGMKLEAIDKKNTVLICVSTVADIIGDRILIHFDGWEDSYDYWADPTSPYIKPVGYCQETEKALSPPNDCEDIQSFTWESYLKQTKSQPVPARAFKQRGAHQFEIDQKLEVVDKRNPILIRVATIANVEEYRLKIHFDGWSDVFDDWLDDDCPDFHPPGWCAKTGHPLHPPISPQDLVVSPSQGGCPTPGCKGIGHIKGAKYTGHHSAFGCPYSTVNMNKGNAIQDRLGSKFDDVSPSPKFICPEAKSSPLAEKRFHSTKIRDMLNGDETYRPRVGPGRPGRKKHKFLTRMKEPKQEEEEDDDQENFLHNGIHQSVFMSALVPNPVNDFPLCWEQHSKLLPGVGKIKGAVVAKWTIEEVSTFVKTLPGCDEQGNIFQDEQIDGEAFLLLNQTDIVKIMNIKLGPALKIYNSILMFKNTAES